MVGVRRPRLAPAKRTLARCHDMADLEAAARRRMPRGVFDYVAGGADEELTVERNLAAFRRWQFVPQNLRDVGDVDTAVHLLGQRVAIPLLFSPTGYTRMMHPAGECAVARAARRAGIPYGLSTVASTSIEELAGTGHPNLWFQLYVWRDRGLVAELVDRAWEHGYRTLEVSVDVPVSGHRTRDVRSGLTIPPRLTARTLIGIGRHPGWWVRALRAPVVRFAGAPPGVGSSGLTIEDMTAQFRSIRLVAGPGGAADALAGSARPEGCDRSRRRTSRDRRGLRRPPSLEPRRPPARPHHPAGRPVGRGPRRGRGRAGDHRRLRDPPRRRSGGRHRTRGRCRRRRAGVSLRPYGGRRARSRPRCDDPRDAVPPDAPAPRCGVDPRAARGWAHLAEAVGWRERPLNRVRLTSTASGRAAHGACRRAQRERARGLAETLEAARNSSRCSRESVPR